MSKKEITTLRRAAVLAGVSQEAMREWCERYGIGRQEGRIWHIDRAGLRKVIAARTLLGRGK